MKITIKPRIVIKSKRRIKLAARRRLLITVTPKGN